MPHVELPHGTVHYQESGAGAPVVLLHGYLMGAHLWDPVTRLLEDEFRCLVPELPFGAHPAPMRPGADLTTAGLGRLVADFLDALDLSDVTLVGNDSGAAVAQVVAARHPERLGGLVLATGDAFDFRTKAVPPAHRCRRRERSPRCSPCSRPGRPVPCRPRTAG
jgi:pimeloyl-ACP methyl ester carboxylesterase